MSLHAPSDSEPAAAKEPLSIHHEDHPEMISRNSRYGLILFSVYLALYGGFMLLSAFAPRTMAQTPTGGVNLAIIYGMGLILGALVLASIYMYLCRPTGDPDAPLNSTGQGEEK